MDPLQAAIEAAQELMEIDGVVGVGEGERDGRPCVLVLVTPPASALKSKLPRKLAGIPVVLEESGPIVAR